MRNKHSSDVLEKTAVPPRGAPTGDVREKRKKEARPRASDNSQDLEADAEPKGKPGTMEKERGPLRALDNVVAAEQGNKPSKRRLVKKGASAADPQTDRNLQKGKQGSKVQGGGLSSATKDALAQLQAKRARAEVDTRGPSPTGSVTPALIQSCRTS